MENPTLVSENGEMEVSEIKEARSHALCDLDADQMLTVSRFQEQKLKELLTSSECGLSAIQESRLWEQKMKEALEHAGQFPVK